MNQFLIIFYIVYHIESYHHIVNRFLIFDFLLFYCESYRTIMWLNHLQFLFLTTVLVSLSHLLVAIHSPKSTIYNPLPNNPKFKNIQSSNQSKSMEREKQAYAHYPLIFFYTITQSQNLNVEI